MTNGWLCSRIGTAVTYNNIIVITILYYIVLIFTNATINLDSTFVASRGEKYLCTWKIKYIYCKSLVLESFIEMIMII